MGESSVRTLARRIWASLDMAIRSRTGPSWRHGTPIGPKIGQDRGFEGALEDVALKIFVCDVKNLVVESVIALKNVK